VCLMSPETLELFGKDGWVGWFGCGLGGDYVEGGVYVFGYRGQADFCAAGLVPELQGEMLLA
jgi:hypothetical protein